MSIRKGFFFIFLIISIKVHSHMRVSSEVLLSQWQVDSSVLEQSPQSLVSVEGLSLNEEEDWTLGPQALFMGQRVASNTYGENYGFQHGYGLAIDVSYKKTWGLKLNYVFSEKKEDGDGFFSLKRKEEFWKLVPVYRYQLNENFKVLFGGAFGLYNVKYNYGLSPLKLSHNTKSQHFSIDAVFGGEYLLIDQLFLTAEGYVGHVFKLDRFDPVKIQMLLGLTYKFVL